MQVSFRSDQYRLVNVPCAFFFSELLASCFSARPNPILPSQRSETERTNLVVTVPAGEEEHLLLSVLLGVQYVVAATANE
jgi:hypothetical protein